MPVSSGTRCIAVTEGVVANGIDALGGRRSPMTTFSSYEEVAPARQAEIREELAQVGQDARLDTAPVRLEDEQLQQILDGMAKVVAQRQMPPCATTKSE